MTFDEFVDLLPRRLGEARRPNPQQRYCLGLDPATPVQVVAGPGTGKTTALVLRTLRHVLVDRILPEQILITTFTKKAATEIRTRLIDWGLPLIEAAREDFGEDHGYQAFLALIDINRFVTGTLDSICQDLLENERSADELAPVVAETFTANMILNRVGGVWDARRALGGDLESYLALYTRNGDAPRNQGEIIAVLRELFDRFRHDNVSLERFLAPGPHLAARQQVASIFERYCDHLQQTNRFDFTALEQFALRRIREGRPGGTFAQLRAILVDEYQDTNLLQEEIYFELVRRTSSALTVVGDDDQSLYRFRGATIELFREFSNRATEALGRRPEVTFLSSNYRSSPEIVAFFNRFVTNDSDFQPARVGDPKPPTAETRTSQNVPVLGMFRSTPSDLAHDLAALLNQIFRLGGRLGDHLLPESILPNLESGNFGDAVVISSTVAEFSVYGGQAPSPRFPHLLRDQLNQLGISCFNPRGREIKYVEPVQAILGLILECIDPLVAGGSLDGEAVTLVRTLSNEAKRVFRSWRAAAATLLATRGTDRNRHGTTLIAVIAKWQDISQRGRATGTARDWPVLDILYDFLNWLPLFQDDPEHQVYLEVISRCAAEASTVSPYRATLQREAPHRERSIHSIITDILAPIALNLLDADGEILASVPRDRLNIMTIHQAKGLEFPMVIVDVSSRFRTNHPDNRFARFPEQPSNVTRLEDDLADCTPIGPLRMTRSALQRTFDDLRRLFYVAFSRPQSVLLLVGCDQGLRYQTSIKNVAMFWRFDGTWGWRAEPTTPGRGGIADNIPLKLL